MSPEAYNAEILKTLKAVEDRLARIERQVAGLARMGGSAGSASSSSGGGKIADDRDLDGKYGNPTVRKDPKRWLDDGGESFVGMPYSHCPPEYLEVLASLLDWKAGRDDEKGTEEGKKYARFARIDAARARGWAARIRRDGPPAPLQQGGDGGDDAPADDDSDIPF